VPPDPDELLQQADALVSKPGASETALRRAISNAYYAVFHFCLTGAADMVCGASSRSTKPYSLVYRSVEHKDFRSLCQRVSEATPTVAVVPSGGFGPTKDFAGVAVSLYGQRELADYDPSRVFTDKEAEVAISTAREAIGWFKSSSHEQQQSFFVLLLFKSRKTT